MSVFINKRLYQFDEIEKKLVKQRKAIACKYSYFWPFEVDRLEYCDTCFNCSPSPSRPPSVLSAQRSFSKTLKKHFLRI